MALLNSISTAHDLTTKILH